MGEVSAQHYRGPFTPRRPADDALRGLKVPQECPEERHHRHLRQSPMGLCHIRLELSSSLIRLLHQGAVE